MTGGGGLPPSERWTLREEGHQFFRSSTKQVGETRERRVKGGRRELGVRPRRLEVQRAFRGCGRRATGGLGECDRESRKQSNVRFDGVVHCA